MIKTAPNSNLYDQNCTKQQYIEPKQHQTTTYMAKTASYMTHTTIDKGNTSIHT
jgi:hypothetical protein